jgi:sigma-B regulation protein RsbU (phosphoserine phosphatase)
MIAAPIPDDDAARLEALHSLDLLDTPAEERFDRLTRVLTLVLQVPMAYISLVDSDRQWFKSTCGMAPGSPNQTGRDISFCGHAILSDEALVVSDATKDERFHDNPLVTGEPNIRFYAGHPLSGPDGYKVGTVCIADRAPRNLREAEVVALREMAGMVERELGLVETVHLQRDLIAIEQRAKEAERQRAESLAQLVESQRHLVHELNQAAKYVRSLLPEPTDGSVRTRWRFEPCSELGGDCFGYDWIDDDHFVMYLLDVAGHGVGAALLSVSVANALRARSLPDTDFRDPSAVLASLNNAFPMERHDEKYFTIWYGVFERSTRRLSYASGGHPPAVLVMGPNADAPKVVELDEENLAVGMFPDIAFNGATVTLEPSSKLYVFSDGVYEIHKADGSMMKRGELTEHLAANPRAGSPDDVWNYIQAVGQGAPLRDDFSLVEAEFA